jgi:hypothetical protein
MDGASKSIRRKSHIFIVRSISINGGYIAETNVKTSFSNRLTPYLFPTYMEEWYLHVGPLQDYPDIEPEYHHDPISRPDSSIHLLQILPRKINPHNLRCKFSELLRVKEA